MASGDDASGGERKQRSFGEWLVYLLPVLTAAAAGAWAVITWLFPHPPTEKTSAPAAVSAPAATKPAEAAKPSPGTSASDHSIAIGGAVTDSTVSNGAEPKRAAARP